MNILFIENINYNDSKKHEIIMKLFHKTMNAVLLKSLIFDCEAVLYVL